MSLKRTPSPKVYPHIARGHLDDACADRRPSKPFRRLEAVTPAHGEVEVVYLAIWVGFEGCLDFHDLDGREGVALLEILSACLCLLGQVPLSVFPTSSPGSPSSSAGAMLRATYAPWACEVGMRAHATASTELDQPPPASSSTTRKTYLHLLHEREHLVLVQLARQRSPNHGHGDVMYGRIVPRKDGRLGLVAVLELVLGRRPQVVRDARR